MAVAVQPTTETKGPSTPAPLWLASLVGSLFVLGGLAVVFYAVPKLWDTTVGPALTASLGSFVNFFARLVAQIAAAVVLAVVGSRIAGTNRPHGLKGGILWAIVTVFFVVVLARVVSLWFNSWFGLNRESYIVVLVGLLAGFGWLGLRFLRGPRFQRWSVGMEEGGWFSASSYKKTQGLKVRRFTILGILVLLGSGILTLIQTGRLAAGETWTLSFPHDVGTLTLLPDMGLTLPLILGALALWVAYRAVNYPPFADFLIATEAEMNKVSWTPRKRLLQDTVVVLVTVGLLTLFLFVVDMFWGWFLSRPFIGVLPSPQYQYVVSIEKIEDPAKRADAAKVIAEVTGMSPEAARLVVEAVPQGNEPQPKTKKRSTRPIPALPEETAETLAKRLREEAGAQVAVDRARGAQAADAQEW